LKGPGQYKGTYDIILWCCVRSLQDSCTYFCSLYLCLHTVVSVPAYRLKPHVSVPAYRFKPNVSATA